MRVFEWCYRPPFGTPQPPFQRGPVRLGSETDECAPFVKGTVVL
jgi:hypothetical protein